MNLIEKIIINYVGLICRKENKIGVSILIPGESKYTENFVEYVKIFQLEVNNKDIILALDNLYYNGLIINPKSPKWGNTTYSKGHIILTDKGDIFYNGIFLDTEMALNN